MLKCFYTYFRIFKNANALRMEDKRESALIDEARKRHQLSTEKMDKFMDQQVESLDIINKWFWGKYLFETFFPHR